MKVPVSISIVILMAMCSIGFGQTGVATWGDSSNPNSTLPLGLSGASAISVGNQFGLALMPNGTVKAWGDDSDGQVDVPSGLTGVTAISAGWDHSLALTSGGTVVAWGYDGFGQIDVPSGLTGVIAISAGNGFSLALTNSGTVVAWGNNSFGQVTVPSGLTGVKAISAGGLFAMALTTSGAVVAWGDNSLGETTTANGLTGVTAISAGFAHGVALFSNGTIVDWGSYGNPATYDFSTTTTLPSGLTGVVQISAGYAHSLAIQSNGTVVAWGRDGNGQCDLPAGLASVVSVSAGNTFDLALVGGGGSLTSFTIAPGAVTGGQGATGTLTLSGNALPGGQSVSVTGSGPVSYSSPITVPGGSPTTTFGITTTPVDSATTVTFTATMGSASKTASLTVNPPGISSLVLTPSSVAGGGSSLGTVNLAGPAGPSGVTVTLSSNNPTYASVPTTASVVAGATASSTFSITTQPVSATTSAIITAKFGASSKTATLTIGLPTVSSLTYDPPSVVSGNYTFGIVTLSGQAGPNGDVITLTSGNAAISQTSTVTVEPGLTSVLFPVYAGTVTSQVTANMQASLGSSSASANLTLIPPLKSLTLLIPSVIGGANSDGVVRVPLAAFLGGEVVTLSSNNAAAIVQSGVRIPAGATYNSFPIRTSGVGALTLATITASYMGDNVTAVLTIQPALTLSVIPASVRGGVNSDGIIHLAVAAPTGGAVVSISSNNPLVTVQSSVRVAAGATVNSFPIRTSRVTSTTVVAITVSFNGSNVSQNLTLTP